MNVGIPPAQDASTHLLNALNDDCIQSIFHRLKNLLDFLSAAETCIRFQENAKLLFRSQYKTIRIGHLNLYDSELYKLAYTVTVDRVQSFLSIFGHLITKLEFDERPNNDIENMIADYCGRTLRTFEVNSLVNFNTRSPLQALAELEISGTNILNFEYHSQLTRLWLSGMHITHFDWLFQAFPKLEIVKFYILHQLECNQAIGFLKLNPQLKNLNIKYCGQITPHLFKNIAKLTPNLEKLSFWETADNSSPKSNERLINVSKLRKLKSLGLHSFSEIPVGRLVNSLIENNVPIEFLAITMDDVEDYSTPELNISQLKSLKKLCLTQITDEALINIVKNLPALQEMIAPISPKLTIMGIKKALQYGKRLSVLIVDIDEITIDLDDFKSILDLAKVRRVKVTIHVENSTVDVPNDFLKANRKWLEVNIGTSSSFVWMFGDHFDK